MDDKTLAFYLNLNRVKGLDSHLKAKLMTDYLLSNFTLRESLEFASKSKIPGLTRTLLDNFSGDTPEVIDLFLWAAQKGHLETLKELISRGYPLTSSYGRALFLATIEGHLDVVKYLVNLGTDTSVVEKIVLLDFITEKTLDVIEYYESLGLELFPSNFYEINTMVERADIPAVDFLLERADDRQAFLDQALIGAIESDNVKIIGYLLDKGARHPDALSSALHVGNYSIVELLLDRGYDIHEDEDEALIEAIRLREDLSIIKRLIKRGADIHARKDLALIEAVEVNRLDIIDYLVSLGADVNAQKGKVFIKAAERGRLNILKYLIANGADLVRYGIDALWKAYRNRHLKIVELLLNLFEEQDINRTGRRKFLKKASPKILNSLNIKY